MGRDRGLKPSLYVMPAIETERDRLALRKAAAAGEKFFFHGTGSAPHPIAEKLSANGIPGIFNAPVHHGGEGLEWRVAQA